MSHSTPGAESVDVGGSREPARHPVAQHSSSTRAVAPSIPQRPFFQPDYFND